MDVDPRLTSANARGESRPVPKGLRTRRRGTLLLALPMEQPWGGGSRLVLHRRARNARHVGVDQRFPEFHRSPARVTAPANIVPVTRFKGVLAAKVALRTEPRPPREFSFLVEPTTYSRGNPSLTLPP